MLFCSLALGVFLAWRWTDWTPFWAVIDIVWVSCWVLAASLVIYDFNNVAQKANHDFVLDHLSHLQDTIKIKAFGLKKNYCSDTQIKKTRKEFCDALENLTLSLNQSRMNDADAIRSKKELEALLLNPELPQSTISITFDLQQYDNFYSWNKEIIRKSVFDQQKSSLIKLAISLLAIVPFGLRFGRSLAELIRSLRPNQPNPNSGDTMKSEQNNLAIHFKYFAFIAFIVIIAIATDRWSERQNFTMYLSNAATMTSLLLGVVAIFYSFISNDSMSRSLGSITTVSSDVREAKQQIEYFLNLTKTATDESSKNTALVSDASKNLSTSLTDLDDTLRAISGQNEALKELVSSLPTQIEQLESKVEDVAKAIGEKPQQQVETKPDDVSKQAIEQFLARATLNENLLTYSCVLSASKNIHLSLIAFSSAVNFNAPNAFKGFLNCMNAMQLCSRRTVRGQEKTFKISNVHPGLLDKAKPYFVSYIDDNYMDKPDEKAAWMTKLRNVEALFQIEA